MTMDDMMDMSPLPRKAPFVTTTEIEIQSPTPVQSPGDSMMTESPTALQVPLELPKPTVAE